MGERGRDCRNCSLKSKERQYLKLPPDPPALKVDGVYGQHTYAGIALLFFSLPPLFDGWRLHQITWTIVCD